MTINSDIDYILKLKDSDLSLRLGEVATNPNYSPEISLNKLLSNHISILGNTGSGKSTTMRKMINEIVENKKSIDMKKVNFMIFDIHDEYNEIPKEFLSKVDIKDIAIPLDKLLKEDWINLVRPAEGVQLPILLQGLRMGYLIEKEEINEDILKVFYAKELYNNVQTEAVAKRSKIIGLLKDIEEFSEILDNYNTFGHLGDHESKFREMINDFLIDNYGESYVECMNSIPELIQRADLSIKKIESLEIGIENALLSEESKGNNQVRSHCGTLLSRIENLISMYHHTLFDEDEKKINEFESSLNMDKSFTVYQFSEINNEDLLFFTSFILRFIYDKQKALRQEFGIAKKLVHFIFDEAHMYITESIIDKNSNSTSIEMFEKVAKEGRKFGIFMILASQRPSELSKTVLSQCNNFILHRIRNNIDLDQMRRSIPFINDAQLLRLSYLKTGSALFVGEAFPIPMEIIIDGEKYSNESRTLLPSEAWKSEG